MYKNLNSRKALSLDRGTKTDTDTRFRLNQKVLMKGVVMFPNRITGAGLILILLALFFGGCGGSSENGATATTGGSASSNITISDPDPRYIMEVNFSFPDGSTHRQDVVINQLLLMFQETVSASQAQLTLSEMMRDLVWAGLTLVGQIPPLGIYQFQIENDRIDPTDAIAFTDSVIHALSAYAGVDTVTYNELLEERFAENDDDNTEIDGYDRSAFSVVDYFQAIPVFDEILSHVTLHPVKVAVIDSGIDLETGQFDTIQSLPGGFEYLDVGYPENGPMDIHPDKHGTAVAGIIASDNGDGVVNGIALRALGSRLSLFVGNVHIVGNIYHFGRCLAGAQIAIERGARIINLSLGKNFAGRRPPLLTRMQNLYMRLFTAASSANVLFLAAASNDRLVLTTNNAAPAGLPASNLLTVGGVSSDVFDTRYSQSATGLGVEIAAPATRVPVCCFGNPVIGYHRRYLDGNSFATPIVTSIAAIVLSVDPTLSGAELKDFLTDPENTLPAPAEVSGIRPALLRTAGNAILERGASSASVDTVMDVLSGAADDASDPPGHMINRLLGEIDFTVSGPGYSRHHYLGPDDLSYVLPYFNFGIIGRDYAVVNFSSGSETMDLGLDRDFELGRTYTVPADAGFILLAGGTGGSFTGFSEGGTLTFTECELTARSLPLNFFDTGLGLDRFVFIQVEGELEGGVARGTIASDPPVSDAIYNVNGTFTKAFLLMDMDRDTMEHLEEVCEGGYMYFP